jgi:8-oxo-dGTP pyrophosphatase MutT (NUDIX family)
MKKLKELTGNYSMAGTLRVNSPGNIWTGSNVLRHRGNVLWDEENEPLVPQSVVVVVRGSNGKFLGIEDLSRGVNLPGGGIEPNESPEEAAKRELWEETGLIATIVPRIYSDGDTVVFRAVDPKGVIRGSDEGEARWATRDELLMGSHGDFFAKMSRKISL